MTETTAGSHLETDHQLLSGCREDLLRKVNGAWKVSRRAIVLNANQDGVVRWAKAIWDAGISRMTVTATALPGAKARWDRAPRLLSASRSGRRAPRR
jgi:hypothetical protein